MLAMLRLEWRLNYLLRDSHHPVHPGPRLILPLLSFYTLQNAGRKRGIMYRTKPHRTADLQAYLSRRRSEKASDCSHALWIRSARKNRLS